MQQIADNGDFQAFDPRLVLANRERIEERLRRMLVHPVACIDDA